MESVGDIHSGITERDLREGARNLLSGYMKVKRGSELLIINEPAMDRHTDAIIQEEARAIGAQVISLWADRFAGPDSLPNSVVKAFEAAEITLFNHPVGGMLRLLPIGGTGLKCFSFANTDRILASRFCRTPFETSAAMLQQLQQRLNQARSWQITCPAGTDLRGQVMAEELPKPGKSTGDGFTLLTFPLGVHRPFSTFEASGQVAIRWLTPAGIHEFHPDGIRLEAPVLVEVDKGKITGFSGPEAEVSRLKAFMEGLGQQVDKDPNIINSWHAGFNPLAFSPYKDTDSLEQWMFLAHANPRIVHFHTIGTIPPGEVSIPVLDPTIRMDGEVIWERGRMAFFDKPEILSSLRSLPGINEALTQTQEIGV
jgi:hypothetical protein